MIYRLLLIKLIFFSTSIVNGQVQNDTLTICRNYILLGKDTLNRLCGEGVKHGEWIEFEKLKVILIPKDSIEKIDSLNSIIRETKYIEDTIIFPENYRITFKGMYKKDLKEGEWKAYYSNGILWKKVNFKKSNVIGEFAIYHINGNLKIKGLERDYKTYNVSFYNENGDLKNEKIISKNEIKDLFE